MIIPSNRANSGGGELNYMEVDSMLKPGANLRNKFNVSHILTRRTGNKLRDELWIHIDDESTKPRILVCDVGDFHLLKDGCSMLIVIAQNFCQILFLDNFSTCEKFKTPRMSNFSIGILSIDDEEIRK